MRIGLYGGTFDPPHLGHLEVAKTALWSGELDAVWFLPCWIHAFGKKPISFNNRVNMCQLMVKDIPKIHVCADEGEIKSTSSVVILRYLQKKNPDISFRLVLGTDNYWTMNEWNDLLEVTTIACPLWVERPGESRIPCKSYPLHNLISSTEVRDRLAVGKDVNELLHTKVEEFIVQEGLYQGEK